jgi:hypothetical protein
MKKKIAKFKKRVPKFQDGGIGKLKPRTALEAAKDLKINPTIATAQTLEEQSASAKDLLKGLMRPPVKEVTPTASEVSTLKSVAAKNSKIISDSYKKSLQGLMDKGKSIDDLVKLGYGTKQGLTNLGLTAPKKATTPKPTTPKKVTAPKKGESPKPTTPKKAQGKKPLKLNSKEFNKKLAAAKSGESSYGNNIVGDLISGPVKGVAAVGAGIYGLYKGIKAVKGAKAAVTNFGKKLATETAEKLAKSKGTTSKAFLKSNADKLKVMSKRKATQKGGLEKLLNPSTKAPKKEINKLFGKVNADKLKFKSQVNRTQKGGLGKMLERKGKVTKMKRGGKKC